MKIQKTELITRMLGNCCAINCFVLVFYHKVYITLDTDWAEVPNHTATLICWPHTWIIKRNLLYPIQYKSEPFFRSEIKKALTKHFPEWQWMCESMELALKPKRYPKEDRFFYFNIYYCPSFVEKYTL